MSILIKANLTDTISHIQSAIKNTRTLKMKPAFFDMQTGEIYVSRFLDGREAPVHILDGIPSDVAERADLNLISGFVTQGTFYTRQQAADLLVKMAA